MVVLGLNGWINNVHDPAAALFIDGKLVAAIEEERLIRRKHAFDILPHRAIQECLRSGGITANDLDQVAIGWDLDQVTRNMGSGRFSNLSNADLFGLYFPENLFRSRIGPHVPIRMVGHHQAHAAASFSASPFDEACVVVTDGFGESESITIHHADRRRGVRLVQSLPVSESLGMFYLALTQFLGFAPFQEGRTMGLAAYGKPRYQIKRNLDFNRVCTTEVNADILGNEVVNGWIKEFGELTGEAPYSFFRNYDPLSGFAYYSEPTVGQQDLAASGQAWIEDQLCRLVLYAIKMTTCSNVVLSGGVALNCSANQRILELDEVAKVYVPPAPGDAGVSIGAACVLLGLQGEMPRFNDNHVFSGIGYTATEIKKDLEDCGVKYFELPEINSYTAEALARGVTVARFNGRMEFGPRALGHRSILANPDNIRMKAVLNRIKGREPWRPVSPVVLSESVSRYFITTPSSSFMSFSPKCLSHTENLAPAAVHVDGTARVQTVSPGDSSGLHNLLVEFEKHTGLSMLINTSFNIGPEPIVASPRQALRSFFGSELDMLTLGPFVIEKTKRRMI